MSKSGNVYLALLCSNITRMFTKCDINSMGKLTIFAHDIDSPYAGNVHDLKLISNWYPNWQLLIVDG